MCYNYVMMYVLQVVFRSASAHVFLFIQISSEMWDFDPSGEAWEWGYGVWECEWGYGVWEWGYGSMYVCTYMYVHVYKPLTFVAPTQ